MDRTGFVSASGLVWSLIIGFASPCCTTATAQGNAQIASQGNAQTASASTVQPDTNVVVPAAVPAPAPPGDSSTPNADPTLFASPTRKDRIGRIVAPVLVNGKGPFRFIVDTGASNSTISPQLAERLGLHPTEAAGIRVNGITGTAQVPSVVIERLQAGDLIVKDEPFPIVWAPVMAGADGILGLAGLRSERLLVDFERNRVVISRSHSTGPPIGFLRIPAYRLESGLITIDAQVGWVHTRAIVDTGAERSLGNLALRDALRARRASGTDGKTTEVYGSTSEIVPGELVTAPTIALGRVKISKVDLVYGDFHIFEVWRMQSTPALIIGMDILGSVRALGIDFKDQELYLEYALFGVDALQRLPCTRTQEPGSERCQS